MKGYDGRGEGCRDMKGEGEGKGYEGRGEGRRGRGIGKGREREKGRVAVCTVDGITVYHHIYAMK